MAHKQQNQGSGKQKQQGGGQHGHQGQQQSQLDPADEAQRQDQPEKLHGDPIRMPGGDKPK